MRDCRTGQKKDFIPTHLRFILTSFLLIGVLFSNGCATFRPAPIESVPFRERAQTRAKDGVKVTAAVLTADESTAAFGVELYGKKIQPVWLEIANNSREPLWFLPASVDQEYIAPLEAAYMNHFTIFRCSNDAMDRLFYERGIGMYVPPGKMISGFVFTRLDEGTKAFNVDIIDEKNHIVSFTFFIPVPGLKVDHSAVDFEAIYSPAEIKDYTESSLRKALEALPCCTTDRDGIEKGDPLNLVVIGAPDDVYYAFIRAGWDETETLYGGSALRAAVSFLFGSSYRYAPVSRLYVFGRPQDVAFQKSRGTIHERNHLRLWLTPMRLKGKPVWIGQISRDIGVRFSLKAILTHKIDPDVDEARVYLIQDLWYSEGLAKFGYVKGVGFASIDEPRKNLTGDLYFTDGYRVVLWVSGSPISFSAVEFAEWENPPER